MLLNEALEKAFQFELKVNMHMQVDWVVTGFVEEYKCKWLCPADVLTYLEDKYGCQMEDNDSNGWEGDVFYSVFIEEQMYIIAGSGYYGGVSFLKDDDEDTE